MSRKKVYVQGPFYKGDSYTNRVLQVEPGTNMLKALRENGYELNCCDNKSNCGRCRVCYLKGAPLPTMDERTSLLPSELREGWRYACRHTVEVKTQIRLPGFGNAQMDVVMTEDKPSVASENFEKPYFIAVDIGTTTIAIQAYTQDVECMLITSYTAMNPQRAYGADVISRIAAAEDENARKELTSSLKDAVEKGISSISGRLSEEPDYVVVTGNTAMYYFLLGYDPSVLGKAPFGPLEQSLKIITLAGYKAYVVPGFSAFVGGDLLAGEMYLENRYTDEYSLLVDLGTNGEIILKKGDVLYGTATAAGPAFEGNVTAVILGADLLGFSADLLNDGILDPSGLLKEPYFTEGVNYGRGMISQNDIRQMQLGKAAIRAGIDILLKKAGLEPADIPYVYLAGGFGYYLEPEAAIQTGLFPDEFDGHIYSIGNSSLAGCREIGKLLAEGEPAVKLLEKRIEDMRSHAQIINLAQEEEFEKLYLNNMTFRTN
ncbi:MAG: DUF4445 domain-containing protein [Lachnospiraceae bacterium]|nr:DUF4445 domain-containing protein [Candidatus Merdinaster equi]